METEQREEVKDNLIREEDSKENETKPLDTDEKTIGKEALVSRC